jgi:hypothetical protein
VQSIWLLAVGALVAASIRTGQRRRTGDRASDRLERRLALTPFVVTALDWAEHAVALALIHQ